jgi:glutaredoxin 2
MQLMKPYFTTTKTGRSTKPSAKQQQAKAEHEAWLKRNGVHPEQLTKAKLHKNALPSYKTDKTQLSNTIVDGGRASGIMANLYKEPEHVQKQILAKVASVTPLYNKGGYAVAVKSDGNCLGSRSRRM